MITTQLHKNLFIFFSIHRIIERGTESDGSGYSESGPYSLRILSSLKMLTDLHTTCPLNRTKQTPNNSWCGWCPLWGLCCLTAGTISSPAIWASTGIHTQNTMNQTHEIWYCTGFIKHNIPFTRHGNPFVAIYYQTKVSERTVSWIQPL